METTVPTPGQAEQPPNTFPRISLGPLPIFLPCPELCPSPPLRRLILSQGVFMRQSGVGVELGPVGQDCPPGPTWVVASDGRLAPVPGCRAHLPFFLCPPLSRGWGYACLALNLAFPPSPSYDLSAQGLATPPWGTEGGEPLLHRPWPPSSPQRFVL